MTMRYTRWTSARTHADDAIMPLTSMLPMLLRAPAPGPLAITDRPRACTHRARRLRAAYVGARQSGARTRRACGAAGPLLLTAALLTTAVAGAPMYAQAPTPSTQPATAIQPPPGTVTLTLAEYNRLLDRSATAPAGREQPPVPAVISRAEIDLRVTGAAARASIALQGEVFRSGPTDVPLLSGGTLIEAHLAASAAPDAANPAPPGANPVQPAASPAPPAAAAAQPGGSTLPLVYVAGVYRAILPGGAPFTLALTWGTPTLTEPGRAVLMLPAVHAGSVRASIDLPGEIGDVRIQPGAITARTVASGRTRVDVTLDPGAPARVTWSSRETTETATRRELRLLSEAKTLVTIGEADVRVASLFDVIVVQGEPTRLDVRVPAGFEVTSVSGASVEESAARDGVVSLTVREPARRRHQFLIALERATAGAAPARDVPLPWLDGVQRETGEVAIEGVGTLELEAAEKAPLHRIDASEASGTLLSLTRDAVLAAFRYQRRTAEPVMLDLLVKRFPDSAVLAAVADRATVTTLVTKQGRALTEVALQVRNQGQPFMKVGLPQGATLLSAEVAGVSVKPVLGADGARVPLLRPGFRPSRGNYAVSFVYLESGQAYAKKGDARLTLARVDLPVNLLEWELFLPEGFEVKRFDGDVLPRSLLAQTPREARSFRGFFGAKKPVPAGVVGGTVGGMADAPVAAAPSTEPNEAVTVDSSADKAARQEQAPQQANAPSVNVQNLQRRVAGVLPVRIDVPRAGHSHLFVRPIVIDEETTVRFSYKARS